MAQAAMRHVLFIIACIAIAIIAAKALAPKYFEPSERVVAYELTLGLPAADTDRFTGARGRLQARSEVLTIEAEDALIAALKAKHEHPDAVITYVRKTNRRGDRRHPHGGLSAKTKK
jgi:hypothetical protein